MLRLSSLLPTMAPRAAAAATTAMTPAVGALDTSEPEDLFFRGVRLVGKHPSTRWDLACKHGRVATVEEHHSSADFSGDDRILAPSLCHPHIHLDKCFLLSHPKYADLEIKNGDFAEALSLTNKAKSRFEHEDLMERGRALIEESIAFGVTHMRAFVEVDLTVKLVCLEAGLALKKEFQDRCYVQICVFAQDPIISYEDRGNAMRRMLLSAVVKPGVEVIGSTPYVEKDGDMDLQVQNMEWTIETAKKYKLHLDFHIDYNVDPKKHLALFAAISLLHNLGWPAHTGLPDFRTIVFGHCTRLTLFKHSEWLELGRRLGHLPVSFVGLPTSDLFMMGRPDEDTPSGDRPRGTLQAVHLIKKYGFNTVIGINNVGNAFTPQGNCDPLALTSLGVGVYQASSKEDADILMQCVSSRAKLAIGLNPMMSLDTGLNKGHPADLVIFGSNINRSKTAVASRAFRSKKTVQDLVYDAGTDRVTIYRGKIVSDL